TRPRFHRLLQVPNGECQRGLDHDFVSRPVPGASIAVPLLDASEDPFDARTHLHGFLHPQRLPGPLMVVVEAFAGLVGWQASFAKRAPLAHLLREGEVNTGALGMTGSTGNVALGTLQLLPQRPPNRFGHSCLMG